MAVARSKSRMSKGSEIEDMNLSIPKEWEDHLIKNGKKRGTCGLTEEQQAFIYKYLGDYTYQDLANACGCTKSQIKYFVVDKRGGREKIMAYKRKLGKGKNAR